MSGKVAFVFMQNAGRSQMAAAFARREVDVRNADDAIEVVTGERSPPTTSTRSSSRRGVRSTSTSRGDGHDRSPARTR